MVEPSKRLRIGGAVPWMEKYRPRSLEALRLNPDDNRRVRAWLEEGATLPNCIFHGPPGGGKTTLAKLIIEGVGAVPLVLDGSADRSIDVIRDRVLKFCKGLASAGRLKIVFFDEADQLLPVGLAALHGMMERYAERVRFIFTVNDLEQLDGPLRSRCEILGFEPVAVVERVRILERILAAEGLEAPKETIHAFAARFTDLRKMIQTAETSMAVAGQLVVPPAESGEPRLLSAILQDPEYEARVQFDLAPYTAPGRLTILTGPPKLAGKSTWARHYGAAKATGGYFLGQSITAAPVLWVGPDELQYDTARGFAELVEPNASIHIWQHSPSIEKIADRAEALGAGLVVLDTLPLVARVVSENDNAGWIAWSRRALPLIRSSSSVWLGIHHHRKAGGSGGENIRGASAIFGMVDVALSLLPVRHDRLSRRLEVEGSRFSFPVSRIITLTPNGYMDRGENASSAEPDGPTERQEMIVEHLGDRSLTIDELFAGLQEHGFDVSDQTLRVDLGSLAQSGILRRTGRGVRGDPYRFEHNE